MRRSRRRKVVRQHDGPQNIYRSLRRAGNSLNPSLVTSIAEMIRGTVLALAISVVSVLGALYQGPTQEVLDSTYDYIIVGGASDSY